jgi:hypothetical protein
MNRLILIGNGFDLAHGLKTSYNDFILWYLKKSFTETVNYPWYYEDELISIKNTISGEIIYHGLDFTSDFIDFYYKEGFAQVIDGNDSYKSKGHVDNPFNVKIKSELFKILLTKCSNANWVDIENEFYEQLKNILRASSTNKKRDLEILNDTLKNIIEFLRQYLASIEVEKINLSYEKILLSEVKEDEIVTAKIKDATLPNLSLILSFNYT